MLQDILCAVRAAVREFRRLRWRRQRVRNVETPF